MQVREPRPRTLLERRPKGDAVCDRPVRIEYCHYGESVSELTYPYFPARSINKMRENCLQEFESHWKCLDVNNMVCAGAFLIVYYFNCFNIQRFNRCRAPEGALNKCMFEKLVSIEIRFSFHELTSVSVATGLGESHPWHTGRPGADSRGQEPHIHSIEIAI